MRFIYFLNVSVLLGLMLTATAFGQNQMTTELNQPTTLQNAALSRDSYLYFAPQEALNQPSAGQKNIPASELKKQSKGSATYSACCTEGCGEPCCGEAGCGRCCGLGQGCCLDEPWTLPELCVFQRNNIKIGGWLEGGIYINQYNSTITNGPLGTRDQIYLNADQLWIYAERATNTDEQDFDIGGRMDYVFGVDGPDTQCFGDRSFDYGWTSSYAHNGAPLYGSAVPQAYAEVAFRDLKVKLGHFITLMGYEIFPATGNFFYSHSYMFYYGEPFTHTGALAIYKFNDKLSGSAGWADGWDSGFDNKNKGSVFLGGLNWTMSEKATLAWYMCTGYWGTGQAFQGAATNDILMQSLVFTYKLTDRWTYIFQNDYSTNYNRPDEHLWYGIDQYLIYKINDCWAFGGRVEWFRDDDGVRVVTANYLGNPGDYYEMTAGFNYKPHANFLIRPEIRYDWFNGPANHGNPFNNGNASTQLSGGFDLIFTF